MNLPNKTPPNSNLKIATVDLVLIALFASLGLATKNILHPLIGPLMGAIYVPTGAVTGGLYMMWPVMAFGFIRKIGAASMVSLTQAFISLILPYGNFGLLSFVIYLVPGLAIDALFWVSRHRACCLVCCMGAAAIANVAGTVLVGALVLFLPGLVLAFLAVVAAISGCVGGFIANMLLVRIGKLGLGGNIIEQKQ
jgi:ABC-type thiamin/hydroxymethylpyrimidine transport system permease subunit